MKDLRFQERTFPSGEKYYRVRRPNNRRIASIVKDVITGKEYRMGAASNLELASDELREIADYMDKLNQRSTKS